MTVLKLKCLLIQKIYIAKSSGATNKDFNVNKSLKISDLF